MEIDALFSQWLLFLANHHSLMGQLSLLDLVAGLADLEGVGGGKHLRDQSGASPPAQIQEVIVN